MTGKAVYYHAELLNRDGPSLFKPLHFRALALLFNVPPPPQVDLMAPSSDVNKRHRMVLLRHLLTFIKRAIDLMTALLDSPSVREKLGSVEFARLKHVKNAAVEFYRRLPPPEAVIRNNTDQTKWRESFSSLIRVSCRIIL